MSPISKKIVRLKAEIVAGDEKIDGVIESFTKESVNFMTAQSTQKGLSPELPMEVRFQTRPGREITIQGTLKWLYKYHPHGVAESVGMKITDSNAEYEEFYKSLG